MIKLIHCADLHLDSKMSANLDKEHASLRRSELLHTFEKMIAYADLHEVRIILISGDLFDTKNISASARNVVLHAFRNHPEITFYYLRGNHDRDNFLSDPEQIPSNLKLFSDTWTAYDEGIVSIRGMELNKENTAGAPISLVTDEKRFNIVMLHGQESVSTAGDKAEIVEIKSYKNKGIDYLALGHIHAYKKKSLDARGTYCYPGCLEGRGFDECGEHGFVLLEIDEEKKTFESKLIPIAKRKLYSIPVDISGMESTPEILGAIKEALSESDISENDLLKVILTGTVSVEAEKNVSYLADTLNQDYFFAKVYDKSGLRIDLSDYLYDESLKGEFVRLVLADSSLSDEEKSEVIRLGFQAMGQEGSIL